MVVHARPLDLAETVEFWNTNRRIGSRFDLMRASIYKRLEERDQDRADANPISTERIRDGARLVAAAATLAKESAIRVPDGQHNGRGVAIKEVLTDWDDTDARILLTRPIFDEGIYGTLVCAARLALLASCAVAMRLVDGPIFKLAPLRSSC
jgi:hypothetical protein